MMAEVTATKGRLPMGLLDKVKAQATAATEMAKDAAAKGQAKLDDAQAKKAAEGMLRDLGAAFYATKTARATPTTDADIERLVTALQAARVRARSADAGPRVRSWWADGRTGRRRRGGAPAPPPPPQAADPASPPPPPPKAQTL